LGICRDLNIMKLALNWLFYESYNTRMLNEKTVTILFYLLIINVRFIKKPITRFIADNKVVYQRVRWVMRLASDNSWARRRMKQLNWRSRWIILCTPKRRMAVSCEIPHADRCLSGLSSWLSTRSSTAMRRMRGLPLQGCRTIVSVLWILFSWLSMLPTFQPLSEIKLASFVHHTAFSALTDRDFKSKSHLPMKLLLFYLVFCRYLSLDSFPR